jgi:S-adenosylmethionine:tRNA-ribosyltransferase-isomerase (queuine synthetase)
VSFLVDSVVFLVVELSELPRMAAAVDHGQILLSDPDIGRRDFHKLIVIDDFKMDAIKTKEFKKLLDALKVGKALVVTDDANIELSARNLPGVKTAKVNTINVYDIMKFQTMVVGKDTVAAIEEVYA